MDIQPNQPNRRRFQLAKNRTVTSGCRPPLPQPPMTRDELMRANEALISRRKAEGVTRRQPAPALNPDAITWEEYFRIKAEADNSEAINTSSARWQSFDSDRNPILKRAIKTIGKWYDTRIDEGGALILAGGCGCGKTHLAGAIYELFGYGAFYVNEVEMIERIQASYGNGGGQSLESIAGYARRAKLLIYDDLGAYETDNLKWVQNIYMALLNGRREEGKATLATTNLRLVEETGQFDKDNKPVTWSPLEDRLGKRVYSRLMGQVEEMRYYVDLFKVPDYRLRKF